MISGSRYPGALETSLLVCTLWALDYPERVRHEQVTEQLTASIQQVQEMRNGYGLRLPSDSESILIAAEFISRERLCCPSFNFELTVSSNDGTTWLRITGEERVKDFLRGLPLVHGAIVMRG